MVHLSQGFTAVIIQSLRSNFDTCCYSVDFFCSPAFSARLIISNVWQKIVIREWDSNATSIMRACWKKILVLIFYRVFCSFAIFARIFSEGHQFDAIIETECLSNKMQTTPIWLNPREYYVSHIFNNVTVQSLFLSHYSSSGLKFSRLILSVRNTFTCEATSLSNKMTWIRIKITCGRRGFIR